MSGPTAAIYGLDAGILIAAAEVILAAEVLAEGYQAEAARQDALRQERSAEAEARRQASRAGRQALADAIAAEEARLTRLASARDLLLSRLGEAPAPSAALPARPEADDLPARAAYRRALAALAADLAAEVSRLSQRSAALPAGELAALDALVAQAPTVAGQLAAFEAAERLARRLPEPVLAERRALADRVLARAVIAEGAALPEDLASLAAELMAAASDARAEALASELRLRVEHHNEHATAAAAALVLEQSLRDLGYEVEEIGATLFVEGGLVHFQGAGWGDYHVRLRVDAARGSLNFNVVRAGSAGEDRRQEDLMAEERWCAEFPRLQATLAARGLRVEVTRMLAAGEVPVQVVAPESLPHRTDEVERRPAPASKAMPGP